MTRALILPWKKAAATAGVKEPPQLLDRFSLASRRGSPGAGPVDPLPRDRPEPAGLGRREELWRVLRGPTGPSLYRAAGALRRGCSHDWRPLHNSDVLRPIDNRMKSGPCLTDGYADDSNLWVACLTKPGYGATRSLYAPWVLFSPASAHRLKVSERGRSDVAMSKVACNGLALWVAAGSRAHGVRGRLPTEPDGHSRKGHPPVPAGSTGDRLGFIQLVCG